MAGTPHAAEPVKADVNPRAHHHPAVAHTLGLTFTHLSRDRVAAELPARAELANRKNILSGGVLMALADVLGGTAASANLPRGAGTTTIESKTNFFAPVQLGETVFAECTPIHRGRTTMVFETRITRGDGTLIALVTQTQLVMPGRG
jgi:1,4-dihydroxy-2-naphthoyl-CoA hydrolase